MSDKSKKILNLEGLEIFYNKFSNNINDSLNTINTTLNIKANYAYGVFPNNGEENMRYLENIAESEKYKYKIKGNYKIIGNTVLLDASIYLPPGWQECYYKLPAAVQQATVYSHLYCHSSNELISIEIGGADPTWLRFFREDGSLFSEGVARFQIQYQYKN